MGLKKKTAIVMTLVMILSMLVVPVDTKAAGKIRLSKSKITLMVGSKTQLKLKNAPKGKKIKWSTSNKKVATVTQSGLVRAKKKGSAKITAKLNGVNYKCKVTVKAKGKSQTTEQATEAPTTAAATTTVTPTTEATTPAPANTEAPKSSETPKNTETQKNTDATKNTEEQKDTETKTNKTTLQNPRIAEDGTVTWDCVYFGKYKHDDENEIKSIKWRVLSVSDDGTDAFLLADKAIDCKPYNTNGIVESETCVDYSCTWENSTIRDWLNGTGDYVSDNSSFIRSAFTNEEYSVIKETNMINSQNPKYNTDGGNNTLDRVFLLSIDEVSNSSYGFDSSFEEASVTRQAEPTGYARMNGAGKVNDNSYSNCYWWLRSPGKYSELATVVGFSGCGSYDDIVDGYSEVGYVDSTDIAIRPALHVDLRTANLKVSGTVQAKSSITPDKRKDNTSPKTEDDKTTDDDKTSDDKPTEGGNTEIDESSLVTLENTEGKRESDVKALQKIITKQLALGAEVSKDLDSDEYWWTADDGILVYLEWMSKNLQGELDLTGLKDLTQLRVDFNELMGINVADCGKLSEIHCASNKITDLNLKNNAALSDLDCRVNNITTLDVSNNALLNTLIAIGNDYTQLDFSNNKELENLSCGGDNFEKLDVSKNEKLEYLQCYGSKLTSIDVSNNPNLESLNCDGCKISSLDVSKNENLKELNCGYLFSENKITQLDLSNNTKLEKLYCCNNKLTELELSNNSSLQCLLCDDNNLTGLDLSNNKNLCELSCNKNNLTTINVKGCKALHKLECNNNKLTELDISGLFSEIELDSVMEDLHSDGLLSISLDCSNNELTNLDVSGCSKLEVLKCNGNKLTSLDVSSNTKLIALYCGENSFEKLDVSKCKALEDLRCIGGYNDDNEGTGIVTDINVSGCNNLAELYCGYNKITNLDISSCSNLKELDCFNNQLTDLDVTNCTMLEELGCAANQLTNIDVSECIELKELSCGDNKLTSLDISKCTKLQRLYCILNQITSLDISKCPDLDSCSYDYEKVTLIEN